MFPLELPVVELLVDHGDRRFVVKDALLARADERERVRGGAHPVLPDVGDLCAATVHAPQVCTLNGATPE
ncbi:hypothetical protein [Streptomyces sp. NPDC059909]|uniref:hypothetical protein n=1 Tax=Streptomyces sp. NPDC059909 TaxID=3346998 RepID=UPI00364CE28A